MIEETIPGKLKFDRMMKGYPKAALYIYLSDSNNLSEMSFKLVTGIFWKDVLVSMNGKKIRPFLPNQISDALVGEFCSAGNFLSLGQKLAYALKRKVVFVYHSDQQEDSEPCFLPELKWWEQWRGWLA